MSTTTLRTAIYCRVSTPGQKNTTSLPEQERLTRAHAAALGWQVSESHVYKEVEGGEDLYRPCMDRLWDAIMRHEVEGVIIDVLDRLSRDEGDQGAFWHHCDRYGVKIELASQDYDETEQGRTMRFITGLHARMEHADIKRRTQRGRKARAASGKLFPASFPLYGYLWADPAKGHRTAYIVDPETAGVVQRIFAAVADGVPIRRLARTLEAEGIPTPAQVLTAREQLPQGWPSSSIWRVGTLQRIAHHPAYWGQHSVYRWQSSAIKERPAETGITRKVRRTHERATDDPARVALPATACPALVSPDLAARAQARLTQTKAESAGRNPDPLATIWRGLARCGHCGQSLHTACVSEGPGRRYKCLGVRADPLTGQRVPCPGGAFTISAGVLDPAGWADVRAWLSDPANVSRLLADWEQESQSDEDSLSTRLDAVTHTMAVIHDKMGRLAESIAETSDRESRRTLQEKLDAYAGQVRAEEGKRERLLREARDAADYADAAQEVRDWVRVVAEKADTFTREEQHATLKALGAVVTVWRADYVHPDGWPQRYRIVLTFTGFTGQPVTLPAAQRAEAAIVTLTS